MENHERLARERDQNDRFATSRNLGSHGDSPADRPLCGAERGACPGAGPVRAQGLGARNLNAR